MTYVKKSHTKAYLAVILAVILIVAAGGAAWAVLSAPKPPAVGVKEGDTFTYSIKGTVELVAENAVPTEGFENYNQTDYFKVTITDVTGTNVTTRSVWRFLNGTEITYDENFDVAIGKDRLVFWAIYPAGLNIGDLLRPNAFDGRTVNNTYTEPYSSGDRVTDFWFINNPFQDMHDVTGATLMYNYMNIYFDQQTGMLVKLENFIAYNNPERYEKIVWTLVDTNVWDV